MIYGSAICNCSETWYGAFCEKPARFQNPCVQFCKNGGICKLTDNTMPLCHCLSEWQGRKCESPPRCIETCGACKLGSLINECLCDNGKTVACIYDSPEGYTASKQRAKVMTIISVLVGLIMLGVFAFSGAVYYLRYVFRDVNKVIYR